MHFACLGTALEVSRHSTAHNVSEIHFALHRAEAFIALLPSVPHLLEEKKAAIRCRKEKQMQQVATRG